MSTYTARSREVTARPRSQRLREVGANGVQTVSSGGDGSNQPRTWEKDVLDIDGTEEAVIRPVSTPLVSVLRFTDGTHIVTISLDQNGNLHIDSGLWSDSFISALGQNTSGGGGGGGGIDADAMWGLLQNVGNSEKINIAHLPTGTTGSAVALGNHTHSQYLTAITRAMVEAVLTGDITSHSHAFSNITSKPTTLSGYGITDAVQNEVVAAGDCNNMYPSYVGLKSYRVTNGAALANAPFGQTGFMMIAGNWSGYQMQLAMSVTSARMYYRYCQSGTWSAWSAVAQTSDITFGNLLNKPTTIAGYGITDAMTQNGSTTTTVDWNTLDVPGCYKVHSSGSWSSSNHAPTTAWPWGQLLVLRTENSGEVRCTQVYFPVTTGNGALFVRSRNSGSWQDWTEVPTYARIKSLLATSGEKIGVGTAASSDYALNAASFICQSWIRTKGASGWYNEDYGGGWYMSDNLWIRTFGSKNIYHNTGIMRTDGTFQVGSGGAYFQANSSGIYCGVVVHSTVGIYSDGYVSALGQNASDIRLKRNIRDFEGAAAMLMRLRFVAFQWNDEAHRLSEHLDTEAVNYGLVAQEAEEAGIDGLVYDMPYGDKQNRYKGIRYEKLIPIMAATIQQQQRRIDDLEARLARLEEIVKRVMSKE